MTRLPLPVVDASDEDFAGIMRWLPAAGLVVGVVVAGAAWVGGHSDIWVGALCALVAWVAITGALHLDGLGDIADASGAAHKDRDTLSAVLADPHIGSFGVVAITVQLLAKLVLLHAVLDRTSLWVLVLVPAVARIGPLVWTLTLPPLHEGLGSRFRHGTKWWQIALWAGLLAPIVSFAPALSAGIGAILLWGWWLRTRLGGISGDGHGAGIELIETALLCALAISV
ncbi:adenosylcobinamide-GDP ribazoletransferase [Sphingobium subterraneum]|uniref:Adenosylcobinamide-GDP ribazoletransferase n=2 Tax=Sphingobium subterraneum TaxID=627688 RepID=A0A841J3I4_9SPHN|nr:adenosylcobinamide-GDP ribazoletransferase [Sphingobium subterraneum]